MTPSPLAVFVDLSGEDQADADSVVGVFGPLLETGATLLALLSGGRILRLSPAENGTVRVRPGHFTAPIQQAQDWIITAGIHHHDVLVLLGWGLIEPGDLDRLRQALAGDPMYAAAFPRLAIDGGKRFLHRLHPAAGDPAIEAVPAEIMDQLPPATLLHEYFGPVLLLGGAMLRAVAIAEAGCPDLAAALLLLLGRARHRGFRPVVANHAVARCRGRPPTLPTDAAGRQPAERWRDAVFDWERAVAATLAHRAHAREALLARRVHPRPAIRDTLLIDASFLRASHEGTSEAACRILEALDRAAGDWRITVVAPAEAAAFHALSFERLALRAGWDDERHSVAVRLAQPWAVGHLMRLHAKAYHQVLLFHDTIACDVLYPCDDVDEVAEVCRVAAQYADALLFNSAYSRDRFLTRFPAAPHVLGAVSLFSTSPAEAAITAPASGEAPYVLLVGNPMAHKCLPPAVAMLAPAFPELRFRCLAGAFAAPANVEMLASGALTHQRVAELYAHAAALVFPSAYEGFGLPIVHGLNAGLPVLARRSALLRELAAHIPGPGRLYPFDSYGELPGLLAAVLAGEAGPGETLGATRRSWDDVAADILGLARRLMTEPPRAPWAERDLFFASVARAWREGLTRGRSGAA